MQEIDVGEIVKEYFPDADDTLINFILWNCTGYPSFWEDRDIEKSLRKQLQDAKDGKCDCWK